MSFEKCYLINFLQNETIDVELNYLLSFFCSSTSAVFFLLAIYSSVPLLIFFVSLCLCFHKFVLNQPESFRVLRNKLSLKSYSFRPLFFFLSFVSFSLLIFSIFQSYSSEKNIGNFKLNQVRDSNFKKKLNLYLVSYL